MTTENIITLIASTLAFLTSTLTIIITLFNEKKRVKTATVTHNRVDWIKDVRCIITDFLNTYIDASTDMTERKRKLKLFKGKACLYFRKGVNSYDDLVHKMDECIEDASFDEKHCEELIEKAQVVFSDVWKRIKQESGITKKEDNRYQNTFNNR